MDCYKYYDHFVKPDTNESVRQKRAYIPGQAVFGLDGTREREIVFFSEKQEDLERAQRIIDERDVLNQVEKGEAPLGRVLDLIAECKKCKEAEEKREWAVDRFFEKMEK